MGDASSIRLAMAIETTYGVAQTAGTSVYKYLRFTQESLALTARNVQSAEIDPTRQPAGNVRVGKSVEGQIQHEWSLVPPTDSADSPEGRGYDPLIACVFHNNWSAVQTNSSISLTIGTPTAGFFTIAGTGALTGFAAGQWVKCTGLAQGTCWIYITTWTSANAGFGMGINDLTGEAMTAEGPTASCSLKGSHIEPGIIKQSATIERAYTDLDTPEYSLYTGCRFGTWSQSFTPEGIAGGSFGIKGKLQDTSTSSVAGTPLAKWTTARINTTDSHFKGIQWGGFGGATNRQTIHVAEVGFDFDNRLREDLEVGGSGPFDVGLSTPTLSGRIVAYMSDGAMVRMFEDDTLSALSWRLDNGTNQLLYSFPSIRMTGAPAVTEGNDRTIRVTAQWVAEAGTNGVAFGVDRF